MRLPRAFPLVFVVSLFTFFESGGVSAAPSSQAGSTRKVTIVTEVRTSVSLPSATQPGRHVFPADSFAFFEAIDDDGPLKVKITGWSKLDVMGFRQIDPGPVRQWPVSQNAERTYLELDGFPRFTNREIFDPDRVGERDGPHSLVEATWLRYAQVEDGTKSPRPRAGFPYLGQGYSTAFSFFKALCIPHRPDEADKIHGLWAQMMPETEWELALRASTTPSPTSDSLQLLTYAPSSNAMWEGSPIFSMFRLDKTHGYRIVPI